ncbi:MAG: DUF2442 domain-containing protein [Ignavibacteriales bacterium]|nr:DUF2442 domain-containing protein [Ignavibacteriales bacterium]
MNKIVRIRFANPTTGYRVEIGFTDGTKREIDLEPYLHGPIFDPIRKDLSIFRSLRVDQRMKTIVWENGADIDPDVLYQGLVPVWMESSQLITH